MIQFDFEYYRPSSIGEATELMRSCLDSGQKAVYYSGGTELMTNFRKGKAKADVVIDLKAIEDLKVIDIVEDKMDETSIKKSYRLGAALSLNALIEADIPEPLINVLDHIADHTTRNALTLGGNICGRLPYKEAVLPLLALDAVAVIATENGLVERKLREVFDKRLKLDPVEFLAQIKLDYQKQWYHCYRETEGTKVDYPVIHVFATCENHILNIGLSGYGSLPQFESISLKESAYSTLSKAQKSKFYLKLLSLFEGTAKKCHRASAEYREHLLKCAIEDMFESLEGGEIYEV